MEGFFKKLFDYQRFERSPELDALIAETRRRYPPKTAALTEAELTRVAAAGDLSAGNRKLFDFSGGTEKP